MARRCLFWFRLAAIVALFAFFLGGQAWAVIGHNEYWPFSPYPMYRGKKGAKPSRDGSGVRVEGVTASGSRYPMRIKEDLFPWDPSRLKAYVKDLERRRNGKKKIALAKKELLALYERRRLARQTGGPAIVDLEVSEATWRLLPSGEGRETPVKKRIIVAAASVQVAQ